MDISKNQWRSTGGEPVIASMLLARENLRGFREIFFTEKFSLSWPNKQRVSHSIVTNNSACKTLEAHSEQLNTSTDKEDQEAGLKSFVCFKGGSGYRGLPRFPLCLTNRICICRVSQKVMSSLHTVGCMRSLDQELKPISVQKHECHN